MPKDPMVEIFMAECQDLIAQYETYLSMAEEAKEYNLDLINEIFRITHTIKADATMMLYECMAIPMRAFEKVLYFCRDELKGVKDFSAFTGLYMKVIEFATEELIRLEAGTANENDGEDIKQKILAFRDTMTASMQPEVVEEVEQIANQERREEPMRFYIGGQTEDEEEKSNKELTKASNSEKSSFSSLTTSTTEKVLASSQKTRSHQAVPIEEMEKAFYLLRRMRLVGTELSERLSDRLSQFSDVLFEYDGIVEDFEEWMNRAWLTPISYLTPKLKRTVKEMNNRLGRDVELLIDNDTVPVERNWLEHLSSALVHLIRNSIDHGIESKESRLSKGKSSHGTISISFSHDLDTNCFELRFSDDGRGIDPEKVRMAATKKGLLREGDDIDENEILNLLFVPGVTTNESVGEYSGRGVGMDVVLYSITELGGKVQILNEKNKGVTTLIRIPYHIPEEERNDTNEDFDSRR